MDQLLSKFSLPTNNTNFNPQLRDDFVEKYATNIPNGSKVLDVSSGSKPYQKYFKHCNYTSHEFNGNSNITDVFRKETGEKQHDIYSPIDAIPMPDNEYDFIICTEVFEHIPEPIKAMGEFVRLCKSGGNILITAPFTSGIHQEPYHFYGGFSPFFYNYLKDKYELDIIAFKSQGDIFLLQNQEIQRFLQHVHPEIQTNPQLHNTYNEMRQFLYHYTLHMSNLVSQELNDYDTPDKMTELLGNINRFTIGYCVLFQKNGV
jgi:ubiquinone/menaquinone biosynthesis C-methylase UbiE